MRCSLVDPAISSNHWKRKVVRESEEFEIADSKRLKKQSEGNGFDFKVARFNSTYTEVINEKARSQYSPPSLVKAIVLSIRLKSGHCSA